MMRFKNLGHKRRFILDAIAPGEKVSLHELRSRLAARGYRTGVHELAQFIRYNMLYRYLKVERRGLLNIYSRIK